MPANLPPEFFEAEKRFKKASSSAEKIIALEELIASVPKHKGTDKLRADLRRRLSQLRKDTASKKRGGRTDLYVVQKEGASQAALVGFPNSGKSSLLASLTNALPVIAEYPLSTISPLPGMMPFEDVQIQLVDLPPIGNDATDGWVSGILRYADVLLLIVDLTEDPDIQTELLLEQLGSWDIHLTSHLELQAGNAQLSGGVLKRGLVIGNKKDMPSADENFNSLRDKYGSRFRCMAVSALRKENLEELKRAIFEISEIIRVYSKPPGKAPDMSTPFAVPLGSTVIDLARFIHKDFLFNLKYARIWGSAKFDGQRVEKNHVLKDRDVVELNV